MAFAATRRCCQRQRMWYNPTQVHFAPWGDGEEVIKRVVGNRCVCGGDGAGHACARGRASVPVWAWRGRTLTVPAWQWFHRDMWLGGISTLCRPSRLRFCHLPSEGRSTHSPAPHTPYDGHTSRILLLTYPQAEVTGLWTSLISTLGDERCTLSKTVIACPELPDLNEFRGACVGGRKPPCAPLLLLLLMMVVVVHKVAHRVSRWADALSSFIRWLAFNPRTHTRARAPQGSTGACGTFSGTGTTPSSSPLAGEAASTWPRCVSTHDTHGTATKPPPCLVLSRPLVIPPLWSLQHR